MKRAVVVLALFAAAGCGSSSAQSASPPSPAPTTAAPGPAAFVSFMKGASYGTKDFAAATDEQIANFGNTVCEGFSAQSLSFGRVVQGLTTSSGSPSNPEAEAAVRSAVLNLCPQYAGSLP